MDIQIRDTTSNDQDPLILEVNYPALTDKSDYLQSRVLIEIGSRSLKEPFTSPYAIEDLRTYVLSKSFSQRLFLLFLSLNIIIFTS